MFQIHKILLLHNNYLNHKNFHILELYFYVLMNLIFLSHLLFFLLGLLFLFCLYLLLLKFDIYLDLILIEFCSQLIFHFDIFDLKYYILILYH